MNTAAQCPFSSSYDPFDLKSPYDHWAEMRQERPVFFHEETGYYIVSKYDDVKAVYEDWQTFSSENAQAPIRPMCAEGKQIMKDGGFTAYSGLSARMPPDHTRIRKLVQKCFGPRRFRSIEPKIEQIVADALDRITPMGQLDFYKEVAYEVPAQVLFTLMGIPNEDVPKVKTWALSRAALTWSRLTDAEQIPHAHKMVEYWAYCRELVAKRKANPGDDFPSDLLRQQAEGAEITDDEIAGVMYSVLFAGHETTTTLMANAVITLMQNQDVWQDLQAHPEKIANATEEILRHSPSIVAWRRKAVKDTVVGGMDIPAGSEMLVIMGSANRDEDMFENGEQVNVDRKNAMQHLSFGYGIHFCPGSQLAKIEFGIMLRELLKRFPNMQLVDGDKIQFFANMSFRVPLEVNVDLGVA
jgi:cytochrome P450